MKRLNKSIATVYVIGLFISQSIFANNIYLNNIYSEQRFTPADKLHAGCNHIANISIQSDGENINTINLVLKYETENINILRIIPHEESKNINYNIENGKIIFNKINNEDFKDTKMMLFDLHYKSNQDTTQNTFEFIEGSYLTTKYGRVIPLKKTFTTEFAKVPECEPDIIPPTIEMVKPLDRTIGLALDSSFTFQIKDEGKGIDKKTLKININNQNYSYLDKELSRSGDNLTIYPRMRLPINQTIPISISISDKQVYGGANIQKKDFEVKTATGLVLENYVDPAKFRGLAQSDQTIIGEQNECGLINRLYGQSSPSDQQVLNSINQKLGCSQINLDSNQADEINIHAITNLKNTDKKSYISVFAMIGRFLFIITFLLKLHYRHGFSKHKKIVEQFKKLHIN